MQIESVHAAPSIIPGHFGIKMNFYNRDANAEKVVIITFDCKELIETDNDGEERKAGEIVAPVAKR